MIIKPKVRGFVCVTAHPEGCAAHVQQQIDYTKATGQIPAMPKRVLVIGSSTGYGLASRIVPAFAGGAATLGGSSFRGTAIQMSCGICVVISWNDRAEIR